MIKISGAEQQIMKILWESSEPMTAYAIRKKLDDEKSWSRTTVLTMIKRLIDKGAITQEKKDIYYYSAALTEDEFKQSETESFINRVYDGSGKTLVASLIENNSLSADDISELRAYFNRPGGDIR